MLGRTLLLVVASLLLVSALASVIAPRELRGGSGAAAISAVASNPNPPSAQRAGRQITEELPRRAPIGVRSGDLVTLKVSSDTEDVVRIDDLGYDAPVGPGMPAELLVLADRAGSFPVTLGYSGEQIGTLNVHDG